MDLIDEWKHRIREWYEEFEDEITDLLLSMRDALYLIILIAMVTMALVCINDI